MKNINLRAVGVAALSTVVFSIGAVLPAMAQTAPTPPRPPVAPTPPTPPTSVRTDILIPTPPTPPTAPTRPIAPRIQALRTGLPTLRQLILAGNLPAARALAAQLGALR